MAEHYCTEHQTKFYKHSKEDKVWYSHPIKENGEDVVDEKTGKTLWCNEDADKKLKEEVAKLPPQPSNEVLPEHQRVIDRARREATSSPRELSIEQQVAIKEIGECWRVGKLPEGDPLVIGYLAWLIDRLNYREAKVETIKESTNKPEASDKMVENAGTQTVLDEGERELALSYVKALVEKNGLNCREWFGDLVKIFELPPTANTERKVWEALDDGKKRLAIGGLK